jgi:SPP1 gp7 family putative phage head morphogenesis protein
VKNADYWRGRFAILENSAHKQADEYLQTLEDIYREAEQSVQRDIESWYQRFATNNKVTLAEARKMLTAGQLEEFKWTAEQYVKAAQRADLSPEWIKKLENASTRFHVSRLEAIQLQIQQQIELLYGNQVDGIDDLLKKLVSNGYTQGAFEIQKGIGLGWDFTALNQKKLEALLSKPWTTDGRTFRDRCWLNKADLVDTVNKELIQGMLRGDPPAKIITAIQKQFGTARYKARRLVHTETTYFNAVSKIQMYKDLGVDQIEIVETLDSRTCAVCQPLDGTVIPLAQYDPGVTVPPFHPNCRGTTCPHYDDMDGERAARTADGKVYYVPANMKYADWKKAFVDGVKDDLTVVIAGEVLKRVRDYESEFGKKFGKEHYDEIRDRVDACENADLQKVWDAYEGKITVADPHHRGGAYCSGNNIYVNIETDAKGKSWSSPYATTFHESGHAIDGLTAHFGSTNGQWHLSSTYKDGLFPKTIKEEVDDLVKSILADMKDHKDDFSYWVQKGWMSQNTADYYLKYGGFKVKKSYAYAALQNEIKSLSPLQYGDLSDILEGATRGKIQCGIGHGGGSYWTNRTYNGVEWGLGTEAFAEMTSATMTSPESLETIKKYLPKSYAMYEDMLKLISGQI